jgi:hypothetical protein
VRSDAQHLLETWPNMRRIARNLFEIGEFLGVLALIFSVLFPVMVVSESSGNRDDYSLALIKSELEMRSGGRRVIHGFSQKRLGRLGDGVSIAILKLLDDEALSNPETVREFLPIIQDAFRSPQFISIGADRTLRVTLFLLNHLREKVTDVKAIQQIQETADFVKTQTAL